MAQVVQSGVSGKSSRGKGANYFLLKVGRGSGFARLGAVVFPDLYKSGALRMQKQLTYRAHTTERDIETDLAALSYELGEVGTPLEVQMNAISLYYKLQFGDDGVLNPFSSLPLVRGGMRLDSQVLIGGCTAFCAQEERPHFTPDMDEKDDDQRLSEFFERMLFDQWVGPLEYCPVCFSCVFSVFVSDICVSVQIPLSFKLKWDGNWVVTVYMRIQDPSHDSGSVESVQGHLQFVWSMPGGRSSARVFWIAEWIFASQWSSGIILSTRMTLVESALLLDRSRCVVHVSGSISFVRRSDFSGDDLVSHCSHGVCITEVPSGMVTKDVLRGTIRSIPDYQLADMLREFTVSVAVEELVYNLYQGVKADSLSVVFGRARPTLLGMIGFGEDLEEDGDEDDTDLNNVDFGKFQI